MGDMTDLLMWDDPYGEWDDPEFYAPPISYKTCGICGKQGLVWSRGRINGRFRLVSPDTEAIHECSYKGYATRKHEILGQ